jgi:hypothetical protein
VSATRSRSYETTNIGTSALQTPQVQTQSAHVQTNVAVSTRQPFGLDGCLDATSTSYGHHRQTSIVHGIHHSRTTSFNANSPASSPLSPEAIASAGVGSQVESGANSLRLDLPDLSSIQLGPYSGGSSTSPAEVNDGANGARRHDRGQHSGKRSRDHVHHSSQSRHHKQESRTVNEYALHHLFTSFVAQADQKIDQVLLCYSEIENPVEHICGPGVDPSFDQLISALGHIARQKPKLLIDTMIYWRKEKGDRAQKGPQEQSQVRPK